MTFSSSGEESLNSSNESIDSDLINVPVEVPEDLLLALRDALHSKYQRPDGRGLRMKDIRAAWKAHNQIPAKPPSSGPIHRVRDFIPGSSNRNFEIWVIDGLCHLLLGEQFVRENPSDSEGADMGTVAQLPLDPTQRQPQVSRDGLIAVHRDTSLREKVSDILTSATTEVWFVGISFDLVLPALRSAILDRLRDGISFTFLFFDAQSENTERLADAMNIPIDDFSIRCQTSLTSLNRLRREWAEESGSQEEDVRIRVSTTPRAPRFTAYLCDPDLPDAEEESDRLPKGYFIPSINNRESHELPAYECVKVPQGIYEAYLEGIRIEWDRCAESSGEGISGADS